MCLCVCVCVCVCVCLQILLFSYLSLISSLESHRSGFMSSSQLLCIVFPANCYVSLLFQCLAKLSDLFDDCFPGKVFFFFSPFGGEGRGSHFVRIIAKDQQIKTRLY